MKPEFPKPFDLEHAKAGAPFCGANGEAVRVLIWDRKHPTHPIIAIEEDGDQEAIAFRADGTSDSPVSFCLIRQLVMLPLGYIDGKPVFVGDQMEQRDRHNEAWIRRDAQPGDRYTDNGEIRWPAPAKVYPTTSMTFDELAIVHNAQLDSKPNEFARSVRAIANAALRHAIDAGQAVDAEQSAEAIRKAYADGQAIAYKHETGGRAARDMAIAEAVVAACKERFGGVPNALCSNEFILARLSVIYLPAIIATIK